MALGIAAGRHIILQPALGATASLNVPDLGQEQTQWCWAGCMQMVFRFSDSTDKTAQCALANAAFDLNGCCTAPSSSLCNNPLPILQVEPEWDKWNFRCSYKAGSLEFSAVQFEIDEGRPIELGLKWQLGGGHAVLIIGYVTDPTPQVIVNDPWERQKVVKFSEILTAYGRGQWNWTWTGIKKR